MNANEMYQAAEEVADSYHVLRERRRAMAERWQFDGSAADKALFYEAKVLTGWVYALMWQRNYLIERAIYTHLVKVGF